MTASSKPGERDIRKRLDLLLRAIDESLSTRPLFVAAFGSGGLSCRERIQVVIHVLRVLARHHGGRVAWSIGEFVSGVWLRQLCGGRVPKKGLRPVIGLDGWWQVRTMATVHLCRIALGRLRGPSGRGSVTLFCGYMPEPGELPVYVLVDGRGRIRDMAFHAGFGRLSPGIGRLAGSPATNRSALQALSTHVAGGAPAEIDDFFPEAGPGTGPA